MRLVATAVIAAALVGAASASAPARLSAGSADLSVTNSPSPNPAKVGTNMVFTVGVANAGPNAASAVVAKESLPTGFSLVSAVPSVGTCTGTTCSLGTLASGGSATVTVTVKADQAVSGVKSTATVSSSTTDPNAANNKAPATVGSFVAVIDFAYDPNAAKTRLGQKVNWEFTGNAPHTVTDDTGIGLYDSGTQTHGAAYNFTYPSAGTFLYICTIHHFTGTISLPPTASPAKAPLGSSHTVTWAKAAPPAGDVFDVQVKVPGGSFADWMTGVTSTSGVYVTSSGTGKYAFRARIRKPSTGKSSGYSPAVTIQAT